MAEEELRHLREQLEEQVNTRTAELTARIAQIKRMNKLFVGRELVMAELKKRIRELDQPGGSVE